MLVYMQMICSLICFGYSLSVNQQADYKFSWKENGAFLVVLALTLLNVAIVLCLFIIHKTVW